MIRRIEEKRGREVAVGAELGGAGRKWTQKIDNVGFDR